jgi:hypothetical protein
MTIKVETQVHRLGDICKIVGGGTPKTSESAYWDGDLPWISGADILGMDDVNPRRSITQLGLDSSAANISPSGSVIIVTRVGLGKVAIAPFDLAHSQDSQTLIFDHSKIHPRFLAWQMKQIAEHFTIIARGTTITGITKKQLADQLVWIPPFKQQEMIVEKLESELDSNDSLSETIKSTSKHLELLHSSILKAACEGQLVPTEAELAGKEGRDYEPANQLLERILAERRSRFEAENPRKKYIEPIHPNTTDLPNLPEGWCWSTVGECFEFIAGVGFPKAIQGTHGEAIPLFKVGSISAVYQAGEKYLFDSENTVSSEIAIQLSKKNLFQVELLSSQK